MALSPRPGLEPPRVLGAAAARAPPPRCVNAQWIYAAFTGRTEYTLHYNRVRREALCAVLSPMYSRTTVPAIRGLRGNAEYI
ncbi:MAG: hypothetical protein ACI4TH_00310 [Candidatus Ornithomonoglobus sp.]